MPALVSIIYLNINEYYNNFNKYKINIALIIYINIVFFY